MIFDLFKIIFDRKHVKDVRNWILMILVASFWCYHQIVIRPMQERLVALEKND